MANRAQGESRPPHGVPLLAAASSARAPATRPSTPSGAPPSALVVSELADDAEKGDLVERFVGGLAAKATQIEEAFAANDRETVRRVAHQLRGAGGGYGFPSITAAAARLEHCAREGDSLDQALAELCDLCRRARSCAATTTAPRAA